MIADVEMPGLGGYFVGERTLVWIPVGKRDALTVPVAAVTTRHGLDYVLLVPAEGALEVAVVLGGSHVGKVALLLLPALTLLCCLVLAVSHAVGERRQTARDIPRPVLLSRNRNRLYSVGDSSITSRARRTTWASSSISRSASVSLDALVRPPLRRSNAWTARRPPRG